MLKANGARLHTHTCRVFAGNAVAGIYGLGVMGLRGNFVRANGVLQNFGTTSDREKASVPSGYRGTGAYVMARKTGGMSSHSESRSTLTFSGLGAMGVNGVGSFTAGPSFSGVGQLVVSGVGSFSATGTFSGNAIATLAASGAFTAASSYTGGITALAWARGEFLPVMSASATPSATGKLLGSFPIVTGELTPESVASAVLDTENAIESGLTLRQALRIIAAATAGKVSGAAGTTITIRNAHADSKDRIIATVDSDGNRSAITLDLT